MLEKTTDTHSENIPVFAWWDEVPDHLKTKEQLRQMRLQPTGEVLARVACGQGRRAHSYDLYDRSQTRSIPPQKARQPV